MSLGEHLVESLASQPCFCFALWLQEGSSLTGVLWFGEVLGPNMARTFEEVIEKQEVVSYLG